MFKCSYCFKTFSRKDNCIRHIRSACIYKPSTSSENLNLHVTKDSNMHPSPKKFKLETKIQCKECNVSIPSVKYSSHLISLAHKAKTVQNLNDHPNVKIISTAFKSRIASYRITPTSKSRDVKILIEKFIENIQKEVVDIISHQLEEHCALKVNFELFGSFVKLSTKEELILEETKSFVVPYQTIYRSTNYEELVRNLICVLKKKLEEFQVR